MLFDHIVFQAGVYHCSVGPSGSFSMTREFNPKSDDFRFSEEREGQEFYVAVKSTSAPKSAPATPILQGQRQKSFDAQFHVIANEMVSEGIEGIELTPYSMIPSASSWASKVVSNISRNEDIPIESSQLKNVILKNLCLDLLLISDLGWPASIDPLHAPLIPLVSKDRFLTSSDHGFLSLGVTLPSVTHLSWTQLAKFRSDPSVKEFRSKMVQLEQIARESLDEKSEINLASTIKDLLIKELLDEIKESKKTLLDVGKEAGSDILLEVIGAVFPPASLAEMGITTIRTVNQVQEINKKKKSWLTAFMKLRNM